MRGLPHQPSSSPQTPSILPFLQWGFPVNIFPKKNKSIDSADSWMGCLDWGTGTPLKGHSSIISCPHFPYEMSHEIGGIPRFQTIPNMCLFLFFPGEFTTYPEGYLIQKDLVRPSRWVHTCCAPFFLSGCWLTQRHVVWSLNPYRVVPIS